MGVQTRWISFENRTIARGRAGLENQGAKGHAFESVLAGETKTLLDVEASGVIRKIWLTVSDRSPVGLRSLRLEMFWDGSETPAVSVPLGDFFGVGLGHTTAFECALFSNPEGRSFNSFVPMPFTKSARVTLTNDAEVDLAYLFYEIDLTLEEHAVPPLYFHASWRRENPNELGKDFTILPHLKGSGRFLGCNVGILADPRYELNWWGEGEVKIRLGDDENPTLCGTGAEDYIGTGWGQGRFTHRTQGCTIADRDRFQWAFYRYHIDDPVYFEDGCSVTIQTIGGSDLQTTLRFRDAGLPLKPVTVDPGVPGQFIRLLEPNATDLATLDGSKWTNYYRVDDWSAVAYFYLDSPVGQSDLAMRAHRTADLRPIPEE